MRFAGSGYYPSFPVQYSNMYNDYSMTTAGLSDPFQPQKKEKSDKCNFVVSYIGKNEPKFEMSAMQTEINIIGICKLLILINLFFRNI